MKEAPLLTLEIRKPCMLQPYVTTTSALAIKVTENPLVLLVFMSRADITASSGNVTFYMVAFRAP